MQKVSGDIGSFLTVCTDLKGTLYLGNQYTYTEPLPFVPGQTGTGIDPTWGGLNSGMTLNSAANAAAALQAAADIFFQHASVLTGTDTGLKEALQLAVWKALYDFGGTTTLNDFGTGRFQVTSADGTSLSTAESWLQHLTGTQYAGYLMNPDPTSQHGLYGQGVFHEVTPVPEATTALAAVLLLLPFGASTLRILRRKSAA